MDRATTKGLHGHLFLPLPGRQPGIYFRRVHLMNTICVYQLGVLLISYIRTPCWPS